MAVLCPDSETAPRNRKSNSRRKGRGGRRNRNSTDQVPKSLGVQSYAGAKFLGRGGFPPTLRLRTKWTAAGAAATASGSSYFIKGNGVYQPSTTFNASSVFNFTNLKSMYKYFRVYASTLSVKSTLAATTATPTATVVGGDLIIYPTISTAAPSLTDAMQQPGAKIVRLSNIQKGLTSRCTTKFILSLDPSVDENLAGGANTPADPGKVWYWAVVVGCDATYTGVSYYLDITLSFDVEFYELIPVASGLVPESKEWRAPLGERKLVIQNVESKKEIKESPIVVSGERRKTKPDIKAMACKVRYAGSDCPGQCTWTVWGKGKRRTGLWLCDRGDCRFTPRPQAVDFSWMKMDEAQLPAESSPFIWPSGDLCEWEEVMKESVDHQGPLVKGTGTSFPLSLR